MKFEGSVFMPLIFSVAPLATDKVPPALARSALKLLRSSVPVVTVKFELTAMLALNVTPALLFTVRLFTVAGSVALDGKIHAA